MSGDHTAWYKLILGTVASVPGRRHQTESPKMACVYMGIVQKQTVPGPAVTLGGEPSWPLPAEERAGPLKAISQHSSSRLSFLGLRALWKKCSECSFYWET